jgi:hypothetical protein
MLIGLRFRVAVPRGYAPSVASETMRTMTAIAYMTRSDWAQNGSAMELQSAAIREWLRPEPFVFAVIDTKQLTPRGRGGDVEAIDYLSPEPAARHAVNIVDLPRHGTTDDAKSINVVVIHPHDERELDATRRFIEAGICERVFVMLWTERDRIRPWLDGRSAIDLGAGKAAPPLDPALVEAGRMIVDVEYNGLSSGRGKDTVVHLVRAFADEGVPANPDLWLRAFFAGGGSFRHAPSLEKLVREIRDGVRHRVTQRFEGNVVQHIRERLLDPEN